ncbi:MAG: AI-2E family transporter [Thermonemataceae bacterium]|nr:AI-2E family transporter [Thermonemataceae bacterium]
MIVSINTGQNRAKVIGQIAMAIGILALLVYLFSNVFTYLIISLVLTTILRPLVDKITEVYVFRMKIPRFLAALVALAVLVAFISLFINLFLPLLSDQLRLIRSIEFSKLSSQVTEPVRNIELFMIEKLKFEAEQGFIFRELNAFIETFLEHIDVGNILNNLFGIAGSLFVYALAISFMTFFLLFEKGIFRRIVISTIPNRYFEVLITAFYKIEHLLSNYLRGIFIETLSVFVIYSVVGTLLDIPYALTIAAFASSINFIPYLGPFSGYGFGLLVILSSSFSSDLPLSLTLAKFSALFFTVRLVDDIFLQPFIFSKSIKAHPLEIFVVIFGGASLAGAIGMVVAIPSYTILKVTFQELMKGFKRYKSFNN